MTRRLLWQQVPEHVRAAALTELGANVDSERSQAGGFSPGLASVLELANGQCWFLKAVSAEQDPRSPELYRREIEIAQALPSAAPAPGLRWFYDDGEWVLLVFEAVNGHMPRQPWSQDELGVVLAALEAMADRLTPSPITTVPPIAEDLGENFQSWRRLAGGDPLAGRLDVSVRSRVDLLADLESSWEVGAAGKTLLHADLRADNMLISPTGSVSFVDWPYAVSGAAWMDALLFLPSVAATSVFDPAEVWAEFGPAREADADAVNAVLAAIAGDFLYQSLLPSPDNLPTLRTHQADKGRAALTWLQGRLS